MKKYLPYILILIVLVRLFSPMAEVNAQTTGTCVYKDVGAYNKKGDIIAYTPGHGNTPQEQCGLNSNAEWIPAGATTSSVPITAYQKCINDGRNYEECKNLSGRPAITLVPGAPVAPAVVNSSYRLLAPLPCPAGTAECRETFSEFDPTTEKPLGVYLNLMIKIFIGLCAVLSVVMIIVGGLEYMTSELAHTKEAGKERIWQAILGLLIALGSYALLNTINPDLLKSDIKIPIVTVKVENFQISGALSRHGTPSVINFNKEAYPAAKTASGATGVDETLVLAIFAQETSGGNNTGACKPNDPKAKMADAQKTALRSIVGNDISNINVSCAGAVGSGGAIGLTQFLPTTWLQYSSAGEQILGHKPDPWNVNDALMVTALKLKADGGIADPRAATCKYFGQCSSGGVNYADQITARMATIKQQIADANKK